MDIVIQIWDKYLGVNTPEAKLAKASADEIAALRQELEAVKGERDRLSGLCDKWNYECDEYRVDNTRLANELATVTRQRDIAVNKLKDCIYVLDSLWDKKCNKVVTQKWADILIQNKLDTGVLFVEDTCHQTME